MVDCGFDFVMVNWWLICDWQIVWVVERQRAWALDEDGAALRGRER